MKKLNLGSGRDIRKGYVNLDVIKLKGVDVVHDINELPLPFKSGEFDEILAQDILEHVEYIPILKELFRIMKKDGILKIRVPHFTSKNNFIDPTHIKMFSFETFNFFSSERKGRNYYFDFLFSKVIFSKITFKKRKYVYNYLIEPFVNSSRMMKSFYEYSFIGRMFPAENIVVELRK